MDTEQLNTMIRIARETNNLADMRRLQKIREFHDPNFSYANRRRRSILGHDIRPRKRV